MHLMKGKNKNRVAHWEAKIQVFLNTKCNSSGLKLCYKKKNTEMILPKRGQKKLGLTLEHSPKCP